MKKRLRRSMLSFLMAIAMVVGMLPVSGLTAWADPVVEIRVQLWVGGQQVVVYPQDGAVTGTCTISGNHGGTAVYEGGATGGTLTLNNYHYEGTGKYGNGIDTQALGVDYTRVSDLTINLVGENVIKMTAGNISYGIFGSATDVTIKSDDGIGSLVVRGADNAESCGINCSNLTVNSGLVTAVGGDGDATNSYGIRVYNALNVTGGTINAMGGNGAGCWSRGIESNQINLNGGTTTAVGGDTSGTGSGRSYGLSGKTTISGSAIVKAVGGDAYQYSYGMYTNGIGPIAINGGAVICSAGDVVTGESCGTFAGNVVAGQGLSVSDEVTSFVSYGNNKAIDSDNITNELVGTGWSDPAGTEGEEEIPVSAAGRTLDYKRIEFPKRRSIAATATGFSGEEDGQEHGITVSVTDPERDATIKYGTTEGTYDLTESPKYSKAGTYTVYYKIMADGYSAMTGSATVTITEKKQEKKEDKPSQNPPAPSKVAVTGVTLNQTSAVVKKRATLQLSATVAPANATDKAVTFKSDDEEVATVSATGLVTAVAPGTTTVTATAGGKSVSCEIKVPGMQLNDDELVVRVKKTSKSIQAELVNDTIKSVESSNKKVATASFSGNTISVKGVKAGKATITVTSESGITATLKVKVQKEKVTTTKIKFSRKSVTVKKGRKLVVKVEATPDRVSTGEKITVKCSNKSVAKVSYNAETREITIVAKKKGICKIKAKAGKVTKTLKVTVK